VVHADGVEIYSNVEVNIWSLSSVLASGHVHDVKLPFLCVPEEEMSSPSIRQALHETVCKFIAWSLDQCFAGVFPEKGFCGEVGDELSSHTFLAEHARCRYPAAAKH
jgi:hypothetical protein